MKHRDSKDGFKNGHWRTTKSLVLLNHEAAYLMIQNDLDCSILSKAENMLGDQEMALETRFRCALISSVEGDRDGMGPS